MRVSARLESAMAALLLGLVVGQHLHNGWALAAVLTASAVAGWMLGNAFYYIAMAVTGACMGVLFMGLAALAIGGSIDWGSGIASAILGAMLTLRFERPLVILGTSMMGASMLVQTGQGDPTWGAGVAFVALTLLGCCFQARRTKAKPPVPRDP